MSRPTFNIPCRGNNGLILDDPTAVADRQPVPYLYTLPYETRWLIEHYDELRFERRRAENQRRYEMNEKIESMFCPKN